MELVDIAIAITAGALIEAFTGLAKGLLAKFGLKR
jgi:hypothetical protein